MRRLRAGGEQQGPQVVLQPYPALAEPEAGQPAQVRHHRVRQGREIAVGETAEAHAGGLQPGDPRGDVVDLPERPGEPVARTEFADAGQGDARLGERADLDQLDRIGSAVAGTVAFRLGEQAFRVVDADRLGRDPDVPGELFDEGNETALDRLADLADTRGDVEELSELLDEGSGRAGELLTRRAVAAKDLLELQRIADAGHEPAAEELERLLSARREWF
ncbi:hypothetical protein DV20_15355 [Amycolatopsis rifamycinica]|uniref:Uncharacterized protein n=1 Tax=Amycolatopsis rifamycinica TaxID=287986 RepID=A0A066U1F4_9PSEU|nr:hypothetical protein DV20_15355 [Amycolatopsis rifamycinica]